jgi:hypothetical protein
MQMDPLTGIYSWIATRWRVGALIACGIAVASLYKLSTETEESRAQKAKQKRETELSRVASQISNYARKIHTRYPTGDVVISDIDLAHQLHKPQEIVAHALSMLSEQKRVQRAPLAGYWKLNV